MDTFLMICYVAADFFGPNHEVFRITPKDIGSFIEVPVWVKDTLLYKLLLNDGSVKVAESKKEQKKLENDPTTGIAADGKKLEGEAPEIPDDKIIKERNQEKPETPAEEKPKSSKKKTEKKDDA